jgi:hypothetical protein
MRALVISDTHFGAWTGRDLLREEFFLERLAPELEGIDELIFLGDLFDFLFGSVDEAVDAADGLLRLIAEKMGGRRLVFLAGNHDHHLLADVRPTATPGRATGTPVPGSTSRTSPRARPTAAISSTPGPAPRSSSTTKSRPRASWRCWPTSTRLNGGPGLPVVEQFTRT